MANQLFNPLPAGDAPPKAVTPQKHADEKKIAVRAKLHSMLMAGAK